MYDCHLDWRDRTIDRARAAYDNFKPLDGKFDENVVLQIKTGLWISRFGSRYSSVWSAAPDKCCSRVSDYAGIHRAAETPLLSGADVEGNTRF